PEGPAFDSGPVTRDHPLVSERPRQGLPDRTGSAGPVAEDNAVQGEAEVSRTGGTFTGAESAGPAFIPGAKVPDPAGLRDWAHRGADAPRSALRTERFDPSRVGREPHAPLLDGRGTQIRAWIRRIEAENGQWVRSFVVAVPVSLKNGVTPADLALLQTDLQ